MESRDISTRKNGVERQTARKYTPRTDIYERDGEFVIMADLPGVEANGVQIDYEEDALKLSAKVKPTRYEGLSLKHQEYGEGDYERTFTLSDAVDINGIEAAMKDGVLRITLPKSEKTKPRRISVRSV